MFRLMLRLLSILNERSLDPVVMESGKSFQHHDTTHKSPRSLQAFSFPTTCGIKFRNFVSDQHSLIALKHLVVLASLQLLKVMQPLLPSYFVRFGRISRATWLARMIVLTLVCSAFGLLAEWAFGSGGAALFAFVFVWCGSAVSVQRLHDRGRSGWWLLALFVPVVGPLWVVWQMARAGDKDTNRYGDNPTVRGDYLQVDIAR
jgi:uncharacterized membrane protein YhaH (DUF805 family)